MFITAVIVLGKKKTLKKTLSTLTLGMTSLAHLGHLHLHLGRRLSRLDIGGLGRAPLAISRRRANSNSKMQSNWLFNMLLSQTLPCSWRNSRIMRRVKVKVKSLDAFLSRKDILSMGIWIEQLFARHVLFFFTIF